MRKLSGLYSSLCFLCTSTIWNIIFEVIIDKFGNDECRDPFLQYEQMLKRSVSKLREHPAPLSDEEIEQSVGQKRLKVTISGTVQDPVRERAADMLTKEGIYSVGFGWFL